MGMILHKEITELIGRTPLVRLNRLSKPGSATIYGKVEFFNPGGSVKDRICLNMVNEAERLGKLKPGGKIVTGSGVTDGPFIEAKEIAGGYRFAIKQTHGMEPNFVHQHN